MLKWNLEALLWLLEQEMFWKAIWHPNLKGSLNIWQLSLAKPAWQRGEQGIARWTCKIWVCDRKMASFGSMVGVVMANTVMISTAAAFLRSRKEWRLRRSGMPKSQAHWLSAPSALLLSTTHLPPSLLPCVILGIYSWPASVYNLNYLYGEMGSLHDSGNRILFVPSN